jgi:ribose/xylose/arabinose/galactoside ABC-type transport system permease subunit
MTPSSTTAADFAHTRRWRLIANSIWNVILVLAVLVASGILIASGGFRSGLLASDVLVSVLPVVPLALLLASGELDLSTGPLIGFASILAATATVNGGGLFGAIGICLVVGIVVGIAHAVLVGLARLNSAMVTFGSASVLTALGLAMTEGRIVRFDISPDDAAPIYVIGWVFFVLTFAAGIGIIHFSPYLRRDAPSTPEPLLRRALRIGLPFIVVGLLAGLAGVAYAARIGVGTFGAGASLQLRLLLVLILGGTTFGQGIANVFGAVLAAIFVSLLTTVLILGDAGPAFANTAVSALLVIAIVIAHGYHWLFARVTARQNTPATTAASE